MKFEQLENVKVYHALDHSKRREILAYILENPSSSAARIKAALGLNDGNFHYHISVLLEAHLITNDWIRPANRGDTYSEYKPTEIAKQLVENT